MRKLALLGTAALLLCGCGATGGPGGRVQVVAGENFWGSIARQIAGERASVSSIVSDPGADPHSYEPTAADARSVAGASLLIENGVGYDPWASRLAAASSLAHGRVLDVGRLLGLRAGENPHRWYSPDDVQAVAQAMARALARIDPSGAGYYRRRLATFEQAGLGPYLAEIARIRRLYGGSRVGASESIFALLAPSLGLRLITPPAYMRSISEGTEVAPQDEATVEQQITSRGIRVWVYNDQNATPGTQRLNDLARTARVPVVSISETMAGSNFQDWQLAQLRRLEQALRR